MTEKEFVNLWVANNPPPTDQVDQVVDHARKIYQGIQERFEYDPKIHGVPMELGEVIQVHGERKLEPLGASTGGRLDIEDLELPKVVACIDAMLGMYCERRSDVEEMLFQILQGAKPEELYGPESRYVNATIDVNGTSVEIFYDTLTTLVEYNMGDPNNYDDWKMADCHYRDDDEDRPIKPAQPIPEGPSVTVSVTVHPTDLVALNILKARDKSGFVEHILTLVGDKGK
jgi:hypothetical protein